MVKAKSLNQRTQHGIVHLHNLNLHNLKETRSEIMKPIHGSNIQGNEVRIN